MRRILMFLAVAAPVIAANVPPSPELQAIKTVYILPMRLGFDQYLANQLAQSGLFRVVTDPKKADAVFTDHLGEAFEEKLDELNPPPKPPPPPAEAAPVTAPAKSTADAAKPTADTVPTEPESVAKPPAKKTKSTMADASGNANPPLRGSFSTGRGNVFLVEKTNRAVVWSTFEKLESAQPAYLTQVAEYVIKDLKHALQPAKVKQN
jgi:hypothetical protein